MTLVAGCYERFIFGFDVAHNVSKDQTLTKSFSYPGHQGAVKCIAAGGTFIVSGGADDQLHIYDTEATKDLGFLMNPGEGAISAVALYVPRGSAVPTHLFSGGVDGTLAVWSAGRSWDCLKVMTGHRKEITSISIHPSGKLALTTSRDSTLRIWDLTKGRCSYHHILDSVAEAVVFSPTGRLYALVSGNAVTLHSIGQEAGLIADLKHQRRVLCLAWHQDEILLTGTEAGSIHSWDVQSSTQLSEHKQAHQTRIRGLAVSNSSNQSPSAGTDNEASASLDESQASYTVASAASDGTVKLWQFSRQGQDVQLQPLAQQSTGARLTCLCLVQPQAVSEQMAQKHNKAKQRMKSAKRIPLKGVQRRKTKPALQHKPKPQLPKPDVQEVGVVKDGFVDFTAVAAKPSYGQSGNLRQSDKKHSLASCPTS